MKKQYWVKLSSDDIDRIRVALRYYQHLIMMSEQWAMRNHFSKAEITYTIKKMNAILDNTFYEQFIRKSVEAKLVVRR